jgi:hypothetical protein
MAAPDRNVGGFLIVNKEAPDVLANVLRQPPFYYFC